MSCCAPNCYSRCGKKEPGVTFHRFPKKEKLLDAWKEAVSRERKWPPQYKHLMLCSKHFLEKDFDRMSMYRVRLRENVVPTVFKRLSPRLLQKKNKKRPKRQRAVVKVEEDSSSNIETAEKQPDCVQDIEWMTLAKSSIESDADMEEDQKPIMQPIESAPDIPPIIIQEVHSLLKDPCFNGKLVSHKKDVPVNTSKRKAPDPTAQQVMEENSLIVKPVPLIKIIPRVSNDSPGVAKAMKESSSIVKPVPLVRIIPQGSNEDSPGVAKATEKNSSHVTPVPLLRIIPIVSNKPATEKNNSIVKPVPLVKIIPCVSNGSPGVAKAKKKASSIVKPVPLVKIIPPVSNEAAKAIEENSSIVKPVPLVKIIPSVSDDAMKSHSQPVAKKPVRRRTARGPAGSVMKVSLNCPHCKKACNICLSVNPPCPAKVTPSEKQVRHLKQREEWLMKKVKVLNQSVRRLKARNAYLKEVVKYFIKKEKKADLVVIGSINGVLEDECS